MNIQKEYGKIAENESKKVTLTGFEYSFLILKNLVGSIVGRMPNTPYSRESPKRSYLAKFNTAVPTSTTFSFWKSNMNSKSFFAATAIALAAASAQAAPIVLDVTGGSASFSSSLAEQEYQFELPTASEGNGTVTATFGANSGYVISGITFNGTTLVPDVNSAHFANYTLFDGPLAAGLYSFTVTGASKGGAYTGRLDVSAVPEPASMAMLLAGMGALGIVMNTRRRRG